MASSSEMVLVIPREVADSLGGPGFTPGDKLAEFAQILDSDGATFSPRHRVEDDPDLIQPIPYTIIRVGDSVFTYRRGEAGGEKRLEGSRSLGVGGHIEIRDEQGPFMLSIVEHATRREILEEVGVEYSTGDAGKGKCALPFLGLLRDDSNPVGRVHMGLVQILDLPDTAVDAVCKSLTDARFVPIADLAADKDDYENWSRLVIEHALPNLPPRGE